MFLTKRPNKYWYVIYKDELTGRRNSISTKSKLEGNAYKFLSEFKEQLKPKQRIIALLDLRSEVLKHVKYHLRPSTILLYESTFRNMEKLWGNILVKFITQNHIEKNKIYRLENGVRKAMLTLILVLYMLFSISFINGDLSKTKMAD